MISKYFYFPILIPIESYPEDVHKGTMSVAEKIFS